MVIFVCSLAALVVLFLSVILVRTAMFVPKEKEREAREEISLICVMPYFSTLQFEYFAFNMAHSGDTV